MTVRQVFYRAVSAGIINKSELEYKNSISRQLVAMRLSGDLEFGWIADNTRWMRKPKTYSSVEEALQSTARTYRKALWDDQDAYVEVWTEKDALAGVLLEETKKWDVPLMVSRGFSSLTYLYEAAEAISDQGKPAYLYYFGDHDPSGLRIDAAIERRLRELAPHADIEFERVAVRPEQITKWGLPTRPTKKKGNTHAKGFEGRSVEVDAIPAARLRQLVRDCIEQHVDQEQYRVTQSAERREREILSKLRFKDLPRELRASRDDEEE
jgi:hypothetical protein